MSARGKSARSAAREAFFRSRLDRELGDDAARLLFADWLEERGDGRAAGYRWMARRRKKPSRAPYTWDWWHEDSTNRREIVLPDAVWRLLDAPPAERFPNCKEFPSLAAAEEEICRVIALLQAQGRMPR